MASTAPAARVRGPSHAVTFSAVVPRLRPAIAATVALLRRRDWVVGSFSLALVVASGRSGDHQSTIRYMAIVPALPIWLAGLGRRVWFDRIWSLGCTLLLALLLMLFSRDFWVA